MFFERPEQMELEILSYDFSVCRLTESSGFDPEKEFCFFARTDEELSLVCKTEDVPASAAVRDDGWRGFRIRGILGFSLIGILAKISSVLAENKIGIFAVSTYNTDYILVKAENLGRAAEALKNAGYKVLQVTGSEEK